MTEATGGHHHDAPRGVRGRLGGHPAARASTARLSEVGELQVQGPYVARYLDDPPDPEEGYWLKTGDIFHQRPERALRDRRPHQGHLQEQPGPDGGPGGGGAAAGRRAGGQANLPGGRRARLQRAAHRPRPGRPGARRLALPGRHRRVLPPDHHHRQPGAGALRAGRELRPPRPRLRGGPGGAHSQGHPAAQGDRGALRGDDRGPLPEELRGDRARGPPGPRSPAGSTGTSGVLETAIEPRADGLFNRRTEALLPLARRPEGRGRPRRGSHLPAGRRRRRPGRVRPPADALGRKPVADRLLPLQGGLGPALWAASRPSSRSLDGRRARAARREPATPPDLRSTAPGPGERAGHGRPLRRAGRGARRGPVPGGGPRRRRRAPRAADPPAPRGPGPAPHPRGALPRLPGPPPRRADAGLRPGLPGLPPLGPALPERREHPGHRPRPGRARPPRRAAPPPGPLPPPPDVAGDAPGPAGDRGRLRAARRLHAGPPGVLRDGAGRARELDSPRRRPGARRARERGLRAPGGLVRSAPGRSPARTPTPSAGGASWPTRTG